jgi:demethylmenaquinone methyltransferase/2-methoxy-6-polyprenyl-1,4-benzoquinol methylase
MGSESGSHKTGKEILRVYRSREKTRAFYDKISPVYDLLAERSEKPARAAGLKKLSPMPGEKLLEIGFGTGHCLALLAALTTRKGRVYGIELSEGMLKKTRETLRTKGLNDAVELVCGDATRLPFRSAAADGVFMSFTLELFDTPDIPEVLAECRRVLRPEGRMVAVGMSREGRATASVRAFEWTHRHFPKLLDCRPIYVRRAFEGAGFRIVSAETHKTWVPVEIVLAKVK